MEESPCTEDEWWDYGEVAAVVSYGLEAVVAFVPDWVPEDDHASDPVEKDWQAFMVGLEARFGRTRSVDAPLYDQASGLWMWIFPMLSMASAC